MTHLIKPLGIALKGKGLVTLVKRIQTIGQQYGLTAAKMDRSLEQLSQILQQFGCRATLPIIYNDCRFCIAPSPRFGGVLRGARLVDQSPRAGATSFGQNICAIGYCQATYNLRLSL
jgi:hypothetical protein